LLEPPHDQVDPRLAEAGRYPELASAPVLFPTTDFAIFLGIVFLGHWAVNRDRRRWVPFMLLASYVFYAWWDWRYVGLLIGVSALAQLGARAVDRRDGAARRRALVLALAATIAPLLYVKYYAFLAVNAANAAALLRIGWTPPLVEVVLPVGVSFYTFMAISYVVDVYRGVVRPCGTADAFLYLAFFPHLVAGPIVRPAELVPQLQTPRDPVRIDVVGAGWLILGGLFKKVVIASYLSAAIVDPVFGDPSRHSGLEVLVGVWSFAAVIYADFSGYTDIAIGVARLLGFRFPPNFDRPYTATSIRDFWRRWHMTLSRWLRDYLYVPLGGSRGSEPRTALNLLATMALGGLWHGAGWTFVVWGLVHGAFLVVERWKRRRRAIGVLAEVPDTGLVGWARRIVTFQLVCLGWVFFRADSLDTAVALLGRLARGWDTPTVLVHPGVVLALAVGLGAQFLPAAPGRVVRAALARLRPVPLGAAAALALFVITTLGPRGVAPFIYFRF
jgi:alginate O-acetyltransferase complex protein AlgI